MEDVANFSSPADEVYSAGPGTEAAYREHQRQQNRFWMQIHGTTEHEHPVPCSISPTSSLANALRRTELIIIGQEPRQYGQVFHPYIVSKFSANGKEFVRLKDIVEGRYEGLERRNHDALSYKDVSCGRRASNVKMTIKFRWPASLSNDGYVKYNPQRNVIHPNGKAYSVGEIVQVIGEEMLVFMKDNGSMLLINPQWGLASVPDFGDIVLLELWRVSKSSLQPQFGILRNHALRI